MPTTLLLRRWLCAWLALLMLTQMLAASSAGVHGAWHRHQPMLQSAAPAPTTTVVRWRHGDTPAVLAAEVHASWHERGQAHDHAATDASVLPLGVDGASDAVAQLAAALAPNGDAEWALHDQTRHPHAQGATWAATTRSIVPILQPPRA